MRRRGTWKANQLEHLADLGYAVNFHDILVGYRYCRAVIEDCIHNLVGAKAIQ